MTYWHYKSHDNRWLPMPQYAAAGHTIDVRMQAGARQAALLLVYASVPVMLRECE